MSIDDIEQIVPTPNLDRWYEEHQRTSSDRPRVSVWYPHDAPTARLHTRGMGCGQPDVLPDGDIHASLTLSGVEFGGRLDELELLVAAAGECLQHVRACAESMRAAESDAERLRAGEG